MRLDRLSSPGEAKAYAEALCKYARPQLDASSLGPWLVGRLMLDQALDHASAERIATDVTAQPLAPAA